MIVNKKRAQFYLMAAIIIVTVLIGVATVTNYVVSRQSSQEIKIYQLSKELELEGEQVVNYGIFNRKDLQVVLREFTDEYGPYISKKENEVYFVYGNKRSISVIGYSSESVGSVSLDFGGPPIIIEIEGSDVDVRDYDFSNPEDLMELFGCGSSDNPCGTLADEGELIKTDVIVNVGGRRYPFEIKEGQNFFFVIEEVKEEG